MLNAAEQSLGSPGHQDDSAQAAVLERRWFAVHKRMEATRIDCEILREVMEVAEANWREALSRLRSLEALNHALAVECGQLEPERH